MRILCLILLSSAVYGLDKNDSDESMLFCSADADLSELLARSGQLDMEKKYEQSLKLQNNLLTIRPNCYDVHLSIAMTYAILGRNEEYSRHYRRFEVLKRQYQALRSLPSPKSEPPRSTSVVMKTAPPKKDKINYWKWLYIYSALHKK